MRRLLWLLLPGAAEGVATLHAPMVPAVCQPGAKRVHFVRHGEATHNVERAYRDPANRDARLTSKGLAQCEALGDVTRGLSSVELIVVSPLTRTLQTAYTGFAAQAERSVPFVALEAARETVNYVCDARSTAAQIRAEFPSVDLTGLAADDDAIWARYVDTLGDQDAHTGRRESDDVDSVHARCVDLMRWILARPEDEIAVVSHAAFLYHLFNFGHAPDATRHPDDALASATSTNLAAGDREHPDAEHRAAIGAREPIVSYASGPLERIVRAPWTNAELRSVAVVPARG